MPFPQKPQKKPPPAPEPPAPPRPRRSQGHMARLAEAALTVRADDIREHSPTETDILIAQAMLQGNINIQEIAKATGRGDTSIRKCLSNPVSFAWVCQKVSELIFTRIGLVDAALLRKAVQGDARAIELFYKRFGKLAELKIVAHGTLGDLSKYSDADVDALIASEIARDPRLSTSQSSTIDVTPESVPPS